MKKLLILLPIFLIVVVGAGIFGAMQVKKSKPSYSIDHIRSSIRNHDYASFSHYVDVDKITEHAADEILKQQLAEDVTTTSMNELRAKFENQMKPEFINAVKNAAEQYISTGKVYFSEQPNATEKFIQDARIETIRINRLYVTQENSGAAVARITFADDDLQTFFDLDATLRKSGDGWHITDVDNWKKCYADYKLALKYKLERINDPIRSQMKDAVEIKITSVRIGEGDEYGFSKDLHLNVRVKILTGAPIEKIYARVVIDSDKEQVFAPFELYQPTGEQTIDVEKILSPFVKAEVNLMKHGIHGEDLSLEILQIDYADGSTLKILEELP